MYIGVGRFRIFGGGGGGGGGERGKGREGTFPAGTWRRNDVDAHRRHVLTRFLINQCQIITFLI